MKKNLPLIIIGSVLVLAFAGGTIMYKTLKPATEPTDPNVDAKLSVPGAEPAHAHGKAGAPVTMEEFGDFECPPCAALHPELKKVEREYGDRLHFIFREFPLEMHKHAYDAARAAEAAGLQGKFWEMHNLLYEKQVEWSLAPDPRAMFATYASVLGMDANRFTQDLTGDAVNQRVALDMKRGKSLGVRGTPTVFVNGRQLRAEEMTNDGLRRAIEAALKEKGQ